MKKIKSPYTYPHRSRRAKAVCLGNIGGYSSRDGRFPLEFNVAADRVKLDFPDLWAKYHEEYVPFDAKTSVEGMYAYKQLAQAKHAECGRVLFEMGLEGARRSVLEDDMYCSLWDGAHVDVALEFHGRCGKHLVIRSFEGLDFRGMTSDDLYFLLSTQKGQNDEEITGFWKLRRGASWEIPPEKLDLLYRYIRHCEVDFTPEKASENVECFAASYFFGNVVNSAWDDYKNNKADHEEVVAAAIRVKQSVECDHDNHSHIPRATDLDDAFAVLCRAAGVSEEELS